jgi:glycosyltransferase involved in cell wall biosynthesis
MNNIHPLLINLSFVFSKPTGISNYATNLFPYLQNLNPILLTAQSVDNYTCHLVPSNLTPAQGSKGHLQRLLWTQWQLPKIYQKMRSRLLFSPIPEAPLFTNCRYIVTVHDLIPLRFPKDFSPMVSYYYRYYIPQVLEQAEHILANSVTTAQDITNFFKISSRKITPILLGYDANHFRWLDLPTKESKGECPYFLYIGRHQPYKNLQRLIAAFATLPTNNNCELWLAGSADSRYTPWLVTQIQELGITERVKFLEYVPYAELPILINQAIALVFPSLWEGFGLPVLEAMACGTPVITANIAALPEVAGDATLLINPENVAEITAAMQAILTDAPLRSRLRQAGIARASQFSWSKTGKLTADFLQKYL